MQSAILQSFRKVLPELPREDAEVKAAQLAKDLTERGLQISNGFRFVREEHLMPYLNEFQIPRLLDEWKESQTDGAAQPSSQRQEDVDIRWETIWELDEVARDDPGELKLALTVEKRRPSNSAELLLINHLVGKAKAKLKTLSKEDHHHQRRSERSAMEPYVLHCVRKFPDSFNDQCGSSNLGYSRFLKHAKDQFDNRRDKSGAGKRKRHSGIGKENVIIEMPVKCVLGLTEDQWHDTTAPEMESEESLLVKKEKLKKLSKLPRKNLDKSKVSKLCEATYTSQRKDILKTHKIIKDFQSKTKKKKSTVDDDLPEITDLTSEWPFLFRPEIILHVNRLYSIDWEKSFSLYMDFGGKQLLEFLVVHHGLEGKILEKQLLKAKEKSFDQPELLALLMLMAQFFKEKVDCFIIEAEDSLQSTAVQELPGLPSTPCIVSCGPSLFDAQKYFLCMDKFPFFAVRSFRQAFYIVFSCFYVFHVDFPARFGLVLEYFQREVLDINPEKGTKRAEGSSSSPVSIKILDLTTKCQAYHAALNQDKPSEETSAMDLSLTSNISASSSK